MLGSNFITRFYKNITNLYFFIIKNSVTQLLFMAVLMQTPEKEQERDMRRRKREDLME